MKNPQPKPTALEAELAAGRAARQASRQQSIDHPPPGSVRVERVGDHVIVVRH